MVDCANDFEEKLLDNVKKYPRLFLERIVDSCAEDMCEITDQSVDAVVSTNVLCSMDDETKVLTEIFRILAPVSKISDTFHYQKINFFIIQGGKYYMLEPVPDEKWSVTFLAQWILTNTG